MERKSIKSVEDFEVYQKAVKLFDDFLEEDLLDCQMALTLSTLSFHWFSLLSTRYSLLH
jgi:hypothetical protein